MNRCLCCDSVSFGVKRKPVKVFVELPCSCRAAWRVFILLVKPFQRECSGRHKSPLIGQLIAMHGGTLARERHVIPALFHILDVADAVIGTCTQPPAWVMIDLPAFDLLFFTSYLPTIKTFPSAKHSIPRAR